MNTIPKIRTELACHKLPTVNAQSQLILMRATSNRCLQPLSQSNMNNLQQHDPRSTYWHKSDQDFEAQLKPTASLKEECRELEMLCMREEIEMESYIKMIERMKSEIDKLKSQNNDIYGRIVKQKETLNNLGLECEELEIRGLTEVESLLEEVEAQEKKVRMRFLQQRVDGRM